MADEINKTETAETVEKNWDDILAGMDETAKKAYEMHTQGLKSALDKERDSAKSRADEIKALSAKIQELQASAGNAEELKAKLAELDKLNKDVALESAKWTRYMLLRLQL